MLPNEDDTSNNPELKVDLDHLPSDIAASFLK